MVVIDWSNRDHLAPKSSTSDDITPDIPLRQLKNWWKVQENQAFRVNAD